MISYDMNYHIDMIGGFCRKFIERYILNAEYVIPKLNANEIQ